VSCFGRISTPRTYAFCHLRHSSLLRSVWFCACTGELKQEESLISKLKETNGFGDSIWSPGRNHLVPGERRVPTEFRMYDVLKFSDERGDATESCTTGDFGSSRVERSLHLYTHISPHAFNDHCCLAWEQLC
jgi:hypothetical protein